MQLISIVLQMRLENVIGGTRDTADDDSHHPQEAGTTPLILWAVEGHGIKLYLAGNDQKGEFVLVVVTGLGFEMKHTYIENVGGILQALMDYGVMSRNELTASLPRAFRETPVPTTEAPKSPGEQNNLPWGWLNARTQIAS